MAKGLSKSKNKEDQDVSLKLVLEPFIDILLPSNTIFLFRTDEGYKEKFRQYISYLN